MRNTTSSKKPPSPLEQLVLEFLWTNGPATAEDVRKGLDNRHRMKEATARTILKRLEAKGYASHVEEGRTYIYSSAVAPNRLATNSVRQIVDRMLGGSIEALMVGMVEQEIIKPDELRALADRLDLRDRRKKK